MVFSPLVPRGTLTVTQPPITSCLDAANVLSGLFAYLLVKDTGG